MKNRSDSLAYKYLIQVALFDIKVNICAALDDGGSNPAGAKNAQASSNNAFAPNYSIDLETELSSLDMTAGSAVGISPQPASSPFADIGKQDNVSKDENGKDKGLELFP